MLFPLRIFTPFFTPFSYQITPFYDILRYFFTFPRKPGKPHKHWGFGAFYFLFFIHNLEDIKFQVIGLIRRPQNWVIRSLGAVFYLTETFVDVVSRLVDGFREEFVVHKVGTRTGAQIAAVFDQFHAAQIDFTISLDCVFDGVS